MKIKKMCLTLSAALLVTILSSCNGANNGGASGSRYEATLTFDSGVGYDSEGKTYEGYWQKYDKGTGQWVDVPGRTQSFTFKKGMVLSRVWDNIFYKDNTEYRPAVYGHTYEHTKATEVSSWNKQDSEEKLEPSKYYVTNDETFELKWESQETISIKFDIAYDTIGTGNEVEWTENAVEHNFVKSLPSLSTYVAREVKEPKETTIPFLKVYDDDPKPDHPQLPALEGYDKSGNVSEHVYTNPDIKIKDEAKTAGWKFARYTFKKDGDTTSGYYGDEININNFTFTTPGTLYFHFAQDGQRSSFAETSWNEIIAYADQGYDKLKERFNVDYVTNNNSLVGLSHKVNVYEDPENPESATEYTVRVIGECVDDLVGGDKATLTLQFDELVNSSIGWAKNPHGTGGETPNANSNSNIRKYLKTTFPSSLSSSSYIYQLDNVLSYDKIKTVSKKTMHGYNTSSEVELDTNEEKFFALSLDETDYISAENVRVENDKEGVAQKFYAREGNLYPYYQSFSNYETSVVDGTHGYLGAHIGASDADLERHDARLAKRIVNDLSSQNYDYWLRSPIAEDTATAYSVVQKDVKLLNNTEVSHPYIEYNQQETKYIKDIDRAAGVAPAFCIGSTSAEKAPKHKGTLTVPANSDIVDKVEILSEDGTTVKKTYNNFTSETKINLYDDVYEGTDVKRDSYNGNKDVKFNVITKAGKTLGTGSQGYAAAASTGISEGISPLQIAEYGAFDPKMTFADIPDKIDYTLPVVYDGFTGSVENLRTGFASCACPGGDIVAIATGTSEPAVKYNCKIPSDFLTNDFNIDLVGIENTDQDIVTVSKTDSFCNKFNFLSSTDPMKSILTSEAAEFITHVKSGEETDISKLGVYLNGSVGGANFSYPLVKDTDYTVAPVTGLDGYYTISINKTGMTLRDLGEISWAKHENISLNFDYDTTSLTSSLPAKGGTIQSEGGIKFNVVSNPGTPSVGHAYYFVLSSTAELEVEGKTVENNVSIYAGDTLLIYNQDIYSTKIYDESGENALYYISINADKVTDNINITVVD